MSGERRSLWRRGGPLVRALDVALALLVAVTVALYVIAGGMHVGVPTPIPGILAGFAGVAVFHTVLRSLRAMGDWLDRRFGITRCSYCGSTVEVRPHGPGGIDICFACAAGEMVESGIEDLYEHLREER